MTDRYRRRCRTQYPLALGRTNEDSYLTLGEGEVWQSNRVKRGACLTQLDNLDFEVYGNFVKPSSMGSEKIECRVRNPGGHTQSVLSLCNLLRNTKHTTDSILYN